MPLLKEVRSGNKGLVGITESGERVPLSTPNPKFVEIPIHTNSPIKENKHVEAIEYFKSRVIEFSPECFYQIGFVGEIGLDHILIYNVFTRR